MIIKPIDENGTLRYSIREGYQELFHCGDLNTAAVVARFMKGSRMDKADYYAAKEALHEWDKQHGLLKGENDHGTNLEQTESDTGPADMPKQTGSSGGSWYI